MKKPSDKKDTLGLMNPQDLLRLSGKKALEAILDSPTPATLVQSLAEEDLYWLINDVGVEDALPILSLASNDQWQYLLDLELWTKDHLETDAAHRWFHLLMKAAPERFLTWGLREHVELMALHLRRVIEVTIREHDESPSDFADGYFTIDGIYYVRINEQKYEEATRELLQRLAGHDHEKYQSILSNLAGVIPAELEEQLYRIRNVGLAEKGFLPFEEAIGIYQYRSPESLREMQHQFQRVAPDQRRHETVPVTISTLMEDQDIFYAVLKQIEDADFLGRLQREFAAMCNRIISADSVSVRNKEGLKAVVTKACGYLNIGIDRVVGKNPMAALHLVEKFPLQEIFRVGFGAALELRWKTEKWLRKSWFVTHGFDLSFWENAWAGMLEGLLKKRPRLYTDFSEDERYREFKALDDLSRCEQALDEMMALDALLSRLFPQSDIGQPAVSYWPVTYKNLLLTGWARHLLGLPDEQQPISRRALQTFFRRLWGSSPQERRLSLEARRAFRQWLESRSGVGSGEMEEPVGRMIDGLFAELEEQYGTVAPTDLDPRFVKHLLIKP